VPSILVIFAHPALENSRVNRAWRKEARQVPGVTFHDLYEEYPEFDVQVDREQRLLESHDVLVLQHPFYWYSAPALIKQWLDLVLEHGWAYGEGGEALRGKKFMSAITAGAPQTAYSVDGFHNATVHDFLLPFERTAALCQMQYLKPFFEYGTLQMKDDEIVRSATSYASLLKNICAGEPHFGKMTGSFSGESK